MLTYILDTLKHLQNPNNTILKVSMCLPIHLINVILIQVTKVQLINQNSISILPAIYFSLKSDFISKAAIQNLFHKINPKSYWVALKLFHYLQI